MKNIKTVLNIAYNDSKDMLLDLYLPEERSDFPVLIFFHGGGIESSSKESVATIGKELAESGIAVAAPNYRLFPNVSYPGFIEDAAQSVAFLKDYMFQNYGCKHFFIAGHSAGAYIAMMLCFEKSYLYKYNIDSDELKGYIFYSGQPTTHFNVLKYRGDDPRSTIIDKDAPLYHIRSSGAPLKIICTDNDIECRLEQTQLMVSTLRMFQYENEVDFEIFHGYDHGNYRDLEEDNHSMMFKSAYAFINKHLDFVL